MSEDIRVVTLTHDYYGAWRKLCVKYNEIAASGELTSELAIEFFRLFEELRIVHGDPAKSVPLGVMSATDGPLDLPYQRNKWGYIDKGR